VNRIIKNETFTRFDDRKSGATFGKLEFEECRFVNCAVSLEAEPEKRTTIKGVRFSRCRQKNCSINPSFVEDVTVEDLDSESLLIVWACAFKHVVLRGNVGNLKINRSIPFSYARRDLRPALQSAFDRTNREYYEDVDWALDIREAEFTSGTVLGVPANLVRRDNATQFILRHEAIVEGRWRELDLSRTYWSPLLNAYHERAEGDVILIAPKASRDFDAALAGLVSMYDAGILERD